MCIRRNVFIEASVDGLFFEVHEDPSRANPFVDVVIPSGLGIARNALVVSTADAVIAIGGAAGTLSELAMAWKLDRLVVGVALGGWSEKLAGSAIDPRRDDVVLRAESAEEAVSLVAAHLGRARS